MPDRKIQFLLEFLLIASVTCNFTADGSTYISKSDLNQEIRNRKEDIARTKGRIESLIQKQRELNRELDQSRALADRIDQRLALRSRLLYRLSRNGGGMRYLLCSTSAIDLIRRLGELRRIVTSSFADRREISVKIASAEDQLKDVEEEISSANIMLSMLEQALHELQTKRKRRG